MVTSSLVSPSFLDSNPSATILDASWAPPPSETPHFETYLSSHIPGAKFFDLDAEENVSPSPLPHMLPTAEKFKKSALALGIFKDAPVVVYSRNPFVASARVWWTLRAFGKSDVYVLDGGYNAWVQEGRKVEKGDVETSQQGDFEPVLDETWIKDMDQMLSIVKSGGVILDARSSGRFNATAPEPRPGLRGGHMPGAKSLPATAVVGDHGKLHTGEDLKKVLKEHGITENDIASDIALTCGSGVTASVLCLALNELGVKSSVYDGSWSEYGAHGDNPVES